MKLRRWGRVAAMTVAAAVVATPLVSTATGVSAADPTWDVSDDVLETKLIALGLDDVMDDTVKRANVANLPCS